MTQQIIPRPQSVQYNSTTFDFNTVEHMRVTGLPPETVDTLREEFPRLTIEAVDSLDTFEAVFTINGKQDPETLLMVPPTEKEGYFLRVSTQSVQIKSASASGLWAGMQTFQQLTGSGNGIIRTGEIRDYPRLDIRGVHWDLKGYQPKLNVLKQQFRILSQFKINTVLLELEDKFQYQSAPGISVANGYTCDDLKELADYAKSIFINVIPKVQCLAHVDYILKHENYSHLAENNHPYQFCCRSEEAFGLWRCMVDEIMEIFSESPYFHIGADESTHLAECPECAEYSKAENFIHRVSRSIEYIAGKGKTPVIWDDILRNIHGNIDEEDLETTWRLGEKAIIMYWAYGYSGKNNEFPFLAKYAKQRMRIWGASGFSGCGPSWIQNIPPSEERMLNINAWTKSSIEHGLEGFINTGWGKIASGDPNAEPHETCWLPIAFGAETSWSAPVVETRAFIRLFFSVFYGVDAPESLVDYALDPKSEKLNDKELALSSPSRHGERFDLFRKLAEITRHGTLRDRMLSYRRMYHGDFEKNLVDYRVKMIKECLDQFKRSITDLEASTRRLLSEFYYPEGVDLFLTSRFGYDKQLANEIQLLLSRYTQ